MMGHSSCDCLECTFVLDYEALWGLITFVLLILFKLLNCQNLTKFNTTFMNEISSNKLEMFSIEYVTSNAHQKKTFFYIQREYVTLFIYKTEYNVE